MREDITIVIPDATLIVIIIKTYVTLTMDNVVEHQCHPDIYIAIHFKVFLRNKWRLNPFDKIKVTADR